jgi:protein SCO1/2
MLQAVRILALLVLLALGALWGWAWLGRGEGEGLADSFARRAATLFGHDVPAPSAGGVQMPQGLVLGGPFSLVDHTGRAVTEADFAGRFMLVYFGFTYCPDVCPTELGIIAAAIDLLEGQGERVVPALITIDPERDTPAALADYVNRVHPRMIGLTGTVTGMMSAFSTLSTSGAGDPSKLSGAIGEVLIASASGLFNAVPAFIFFYFLRNRLQVGMSDLQEIVNSLFRKMPYAHLKDCHVGEEEFYAAVPNWVAGGAAAEPAHA